MENTVTEELIMYRTFSYLDYLSTLSLLVQSCIYGALLMTPFKLVDQEYHSYLALGVILVEILRLYCIIRRGLYPFIRITSLYAARSDASLCLDLLRQETLKGPIRTSYMCTYGSCTAILRLDLSDLPIAFHAGVADREINQLANSIAEKNFMGTSRHLSQRTCLSTNIQVEYSYSSLHCTKSWGGIARWIAKRRLGNSISDRSQDTAPTEATPLLEKDKPQSMDAEKLHS